MFHFIRLGRLARRLFSVGRGQKLKVILQRKIDPGSTINRVWRTNFEVFHQHVEVTLPLAGQYRETLQCNGHIIFVHNALHLSKVSSGLRFIHVGDGNEADLEALLGLL